MTELPNTHAKRSDYTAGVSLARACLMDQIQHAEELGDTLVAHKLRMAILSCDEAAEEAFKAQQKEPA